MISILRITASYLLIQKRLKPSHHFIRHVIGNILDEFGARCRIANRARLVAHNHALCLRARIHRTEIDGDPGLRSASSRLPLRQPGFKFSFIIMPRLTASAATRGTRTNADGNS